MTTIAYRDGVLATDSLCQNGYTQFHLCKIHLVEGSILAGAGTHQEVLEFVKWVSLGRKEEKKPKFEDLEILEISPDGKVLHYWDSHDPVEIPIDEVKFWAIGSGARFALGAMEFGATAIQAIAVAKRHDSSTNGPIRWIRVGEIDIHTEKES